MNTKIKKRIYAVIEFFVEMVLPFCLVFGFFLLLGYAVHQAHQRQKTIDEGIASGRLLKVNDYLFEKMTIDGHEYLKFNDSITHSGSCSCFRKKEVDTK